MTMDIIRTIKDCEGCAERREKIKATMNAIINWASRPRPLAPGEPSPTLTQSPPVVQQSPPRPRTTKR